MNLPQLLRNKLLFRAVRITASVRQNRRLSGLRETLLSRQRSGEGELELSVISGGLTKKETRMEAIS